MKAPFSQEGGAFLWALQNAGALYPWFETPESDPSFNWGVNNLDRGIYRWHIKCSNANYPEQGSVSATLVMTIY